MSEDPRERSIRTGEPCLVCGVRHGTDHGVLAQVSGDGFRIRQSRLLKAEESRRLLEEKRASGGLVVGSRAVRP